MFSRGRVGEQVIHGPLSPALPAAPARRAASRGRGRWRHRHAHRAAPGRRARRADRAREDPRGARHERRALHRLDGGTRADGGGARAAPALRQARARVARGERAPHHRAHPARHGGAAVRDARDRAARPSRRVILVGGEALYDLVPRDDGTLAAHPGGGPFNTARTIARLEQPVAYLGRLSTDRFGRELERLLADDGVGLDGLIHTAEPTTLALAEVDEHGGASYGFYTEGTAAAGLTADEALGALPGGVDTLHVGTLGLALEPVAAAVEAVIERLSETALVAVDPNVRAGAITDANRYRARLARVIDRSHLVKVSEDDLAWLDPQRPWHEAAAALLAR